MAEQNEVQDLHISEPAKPDQNWARSQPITVVASKDRLDQPHQTVTIKNTSDVTPGLRGKIVPQKHIVIDRHMTGHELDPGQSKADVEMLVTDIEYFLKQRAPNRFDRLGNKLPLHPIEIVGFKPIERPTAKS